MRAVRTIIPVLILGMTLAHAGDKKNKKDDPSQIGNREVGKGINIYSPEKEIALGKQLAGELGQASLPICYDRSRSRSSMLVDAANMPSGSHF